MKIAIYDPYIIACGGGEKVIAVIGETLSTNGHQVDFICNKWFDFARLEKIFLVKLSNVNLRLVENLFSIPKISAEYDIFINLTLTPQFRPGRNGIY